MVPGFSCETRFRWNRGWRFPITGPMSSLPRRAVVAALSALTFVALFLAGCGQAPPDQDPESAANAFFASLEKGDAHGAFESSAFAFQAAQNFDSFVYNARALGLIGGQPPVWTATNSDGTRTRLDGALVTQSGEPLGISVTLTPYGKGWQVFLLETTANQKNARPENRFTQVGEGPGFDDAYHQPMPDPQQLADLIHGTIGKFATAVNTADFHAFYLAISQRWKQPTAQDWGHGTTEVVLKRHFQPFIDHKIDLTSLAGLPPIFDQPPSINHDGILELHGHFNAPQYRVIFDLSYAYELPRWRLFGINLEIRQ